MKKIRLGRTELMVTKTGFGALPIQRISREDAAAILRAAYDSGIDFYDTANLYTDSEEKIGYALHDVRHEIVIATKSGASDRKTVQAQIENSLRMLRTDYIDLFQFHNPESLPDPEDSEGAFAAVLEAKEKGYIRHVGITNHRLPLAFDAVESGLFETMQFPFSYLASDREVELVKACEDADMGFIAMKGLAGGLLTNVEACHGFMKRFPGVVPIWGIQSMEQLKQWLDAAEADLDLTPQHSAQIEADREMLVGGFCRSCGYCMPCPVGIDIKNAARMNMLLRRAPYQPYLTEEWYREMHKIRDCMECGQCKSRCPYELDTPALLKEMLADYEAFYQAHK